MNRLHIHQVHKFLDFAVRRSCLFADHHIAVFHAGRLLLPADYKIVDLSMFIRETDIKPEIAVDDLFVVDLAHVVPPCRNDLRIHRIPRFVLDPVCDHGIRVIFHSPAI